MNDVKLKLDWCSHKAAKYAVEHWHYSKSLSVGKTVKIGVWENNNFIGLVLFSYGANPNLYKPYNLKQIECCELTRVALNSHKSEVTKIISISLKMIKKQSPKLRLIVSFADSNQNHLGIIYQAGNWVYTGIGKSTPQYFVNNKWIHQRQLGSLGYSIKDNKFKMRKIKDKYRYLYPLDNEMREQIEKLRKPYPKSLCAGSSKSEQAIPNSKVAENYRPQRSIITKPKIKKLAKSQ